MIRINGTRNSLLASHLAESIAGAVTIRAFEDEERFFAKNLDLIDENSTSFFHSFTAKEWLIQRLETLSAIVIATSALFTTLLHQGYGASGLYQYLRVHENGFNAQNVLCLCTRVPLSFVEHKYIVGLSVSVGRLCWNGTIIWSFCEWIPRTFNK